MIASLFVLALAVSVLLHLVLRKPAFSVGLIDIPQGRKAHQTAVPLIGGLAMFAAYLVSMVLLTPGGDVVVLLACAALLVCCGLVDDLLFLTPLCKLVLQALAAVILIGGAGEVICWIGWTMHLAGLHGSIAGIALTLLFLVGMTNAINMMDGADGLGGGIALIAAAWLALAAALAGRAEEAACLVLLAAVIVGFLVFNARFAGRRQAAVFMGDAGSLMLGFLLAAFASRLCQRSSPSIPLVALLYVFALPIIDAASVILRRLAAGNTPLHGDSSHLHQLCRRVGWSEERTVNTLLSIAALLGGGGVLGWYAGVPDGFLALGLVLAALLHTAFVRHCSTISRGAQTAPEVGLSRAIGTNPS
jgi:UDP-GlcNAc:undecaprenyl-phosphate GlcNAc-1-phosphate transferase